MEPAASSDREQAEAARRVRALGLRHDDLGVLTPDPAHHRLIDDSNREALTGVGQGRRRRRAAFVCRPERAALSLENIERHYALSMAPTDILELAQAPDRAAEACAILQRHSAGCVRGLTSHAGQEVA